MKSENSNSVEEDRSDSFDQTLYIYIFIYIGTQYGTYIYIIYIYIYTYIYYKASAQPRKQFLICSSFSREKWPSVAHLLVTKHKPDIYIYIKQECYCAWIPQSSFLSEVIGMFGQGREGFCNHKPFIKVISLQLFLYH